MRNIKKSPEITVSVTACKRPKMLDDLIRSFELQTYKNSELVIVDDGVTDQSVEKLVKKYQKKDKRIKYFKNKSNLGYCKNFLKSILLAKGKYIITMGDDDIFLTDNVLKKYVDIFRTYPDVDYIYSNIMQFNETYEVDFISAHFPKDILYKKTVDSLKSTWLSSCYIPGIGLRNRKDLKDLYPKDDILFPQVELIGKILGERQSYGVGEFLIGGRAHRQQLGFAAIQGKGIKNNEEHSVVELDMIYDRVMDYYKNILKKKVTIDRKLVHDFFEQTHATILPNEKIQAGNARVWLTFTRAYKNNPLIITNIRFMTYLLMALLLPARVLFFLKEARKRQLIEMYHREEKQYFNSYIEKIHKVHL